MNSKRETVSLPQYKGYFVWEKGVGEKITPAKVDKDRLGMNSTKEWKEKTVASHPLTIEQWDLSLNELIKLYPKPEDQK